MANIAFTATGARGHIGYYDVPARGSVRLELINASYNGVKVYPALLYVQNGGNNSGVAVTDDNGVTQTIQSFVNHVINIAGSRSVKVVNAGQSPCRLIVIDKYAAADNYANLAVSSNADSAGINDALYHFDITTALFTNSGAAEFAVTSGGVTFGNITFAKFGIGCLTYPLGAFVTISNAGFFDMSKNFTLDVWVNITGFAAGTKKILSFGSVAAGTTVNISGAGAGLPTQAILDVNGTAVTSAAAVITGGTYIFIRLIKDDGIWYLWVNGVLAVINNAAYTGALTYLTLGAPGGANGFQGYGDELRFSKGYVPDAPGLVPTEAYL